MFRSLTRERNRRFGILLSSCCCLEANPLRFIVDDRNSDMIMRTSAASLV